MKLKTTIIISIFLIISVAIAQEDKRYMSKNADGTYTVYEVGKAQLGDKNKKETREAAKLEALQKAVERAAGKFVWSEKKYQNEDLQSSDLFLAWGAYVKINELEYHYDKMSETATYAAEFVIDPQVMREFAEKQIETQKEDRKNQEQDIEITFDFYDSSGERLREGDVVQQGDQYQIMVKPKQKCHLYVINRDQKGAVYALFPRQEISTENPLQPNQEYYFPGSGNMFRFDNVIGLESFYFVASLSPLKNIEFLIDKIEELGGETEQARGLSRAIEQDLKRRGGAGIVQNNNTEKSQKAAEILRSKGSLVRQINLVHK